MMVVRFGQVGWVNQAGSLRDLKQNQAEEESGGDMIIKTRPAVDCWIALIGNA